MFTILSRVVTANAPYLESTNFWSIICLLQTTTRSHFCSTLCKSSTQTISLDLKCQKKKIGLHVYEAKIDVGTKKHQKDSFFVNVIQTHASGVGGVLPVSWSREEEKSIPGGGVEGCKEKSSRTITTPCTQDRHFPKALLLESNPELGHFTLNGTTRSSQSWKHQWKPQRGHHSRDPPITYIYISCVCAKPQSDHSIRMSFLLGVQILYLENLMGIFYLWVRDSECAFYSTQPSRTVLLSICTHKPQMGQIISQILSPRFKNCTSRRSSKNLVRRRITFFCR